MLSKNIEQTALSRDYWNSVKMLIEEDIIKLINLFKFLELQKYKILKLKFLLNKKENNEIISCHQFS